MVKILWRVQHAPGRDPSRLLAGLPVDTEIVTDDGPPPPNPWRGYQLCLSNLPDCTHVAVFQDDALPCRNLPAAVDLLTQARPVDVISLFVGGLRNRTTKEFMRALQFGRHWAPVAYRDIHHCVAVVWPVADASEFLAWAGSADVPGYSKGRLPRSDDAMLGAFARQTKRQIWATVPCLVEHPDDVESTIGLRASAGKDRGRVAVQWIGDGDPVAIDWSV